MTDRVVENESEEIPEIPELLEQVMIMALEEAKEIMLAGDDVTPFTCAVVNDNVFIETHPGEDAEECFEKAKAEISEARGAAAYAFCYDGFVETDEGPLDVMIAEGGMPGNPDGFAIGMIYEETEEGFVIEEEPVYIGDAPNFMMDMYDPSLYDEDEINPKYLSEDFEEEAE